MAEAIVSIVVTVFIYLAGFFLLKKRSFLRKKKSEFIKRTCFVGALNIFLLLLCFAWMLFYTTPRKTEIAAAACAVSLLAFLGFAVAPFLPKEATGKLLRGCAVLCILPFLLELFVFNAKSFDLKQKEYIPAAIAAETPDTVRIDGESIYFTGAGSVVIHLDQTDLKACLLYTSSGTISAQSGSARMILYASLKFPRAARKNMNWIRKRVI